jgi:hypothetical protein
MHIVKNMMVGSLWDHVGIMLLVTLYNNRLKMTKFGALHSEIHPFDFYPFFTIQRIQVRIDPPHPHACRKRRLNGAVFRMRPEKPRSRVTAGVTQ